MFERIASPLPALRIASVSVRELRNLSHLDVAPGPRFNVVSGGNGQGKTSLLEAVYLVMTCKSFRTSRLAEVVAHGAGQGSVRAELVEGEERREQVVGLDGARRHVTLAGKRPPSLAAYAVRSPVVVFHPGEMMLSSGPASHRRLLLDRLSLFVDPATLDHLQRYGVANRSRQRVLEQRGTGAAELAAFERLMGQHGAAIARVRDASALRLAPALSAAFDRMTNGARRIVSSYAPGGPPSEQELVEALERGRERDRVRGSASTGPHRDDLVLTLDGHDARTEASQGEHRAVTMALKLAELACVAEARGVYPVLLLDDVSSELDRERTRFLFGLLRDTRGQVFVTTTRPELVDLGGEVERRDFELSAGALR